jgi:AbrB family looped-hinge helix DNA binding protein
MFTDSANRRFADPSIRLVGALQWPEEGVAMAKTITMSREGRLTVPAEARRALGLHDETEFEFEVDEDGDALLLRPVLRVSRRDAWEFSADERALLERSLEESRAGNVLKLSEEDLGNQRRSD